MPMPPPMPPRPPNPFPNPGQRAAQNAARQAQQAMQRAAGAGAYMYGRGHAAAPSAPYGGSRSASAAGTAVRIGFGALAVA